MSLYEITTLLWRRRSVVAGVAAGLAVIGFALVLLGRTTTYTARAQVLVDQPQLLGNVSGLNVPNKLATLGPTFCRLVKGDEAIARIAEEAETSEQVARDVLGCAPIEGTTVILVSAVSGSAETSQAVAQAGADILAAAIDGRYSGPAVPERERIDAVVLTAAQRPGPDPDRLLRQLALVAIGALVLAAAFAVAAEPHRRDSLVVDDVLAATPRTPDDVGAGSRR